MDRRARFSGNNIEEEYLEEEDELVRELRKIRIEEGIGKKDDPKEKILQATADQVSLFDDSPPVHSLKFTTGPSSRITWGVLFSYNGNRASLKSQQNFLKLLSEEASWTSEKPFISIGELFKDQFGSICGFDEREAKRRHRNAARAHLEYIAHSSFWNSPIAEFLCGALDSDLEKIKLLSNQSDATIEVFLAIEYMVRDKIAEAFALVLSAFKTVGFSMLYNGESQLIPPIRPAFLLLALLENVEPKNLEALFKKIEVDVVLGIEGREFFQSVISANNESIKQAAKRLLTRLEKDEAAKKASKFLASELITVFFKEQNKLDQVPFLINQAAEDGNPFALYLKFKDVNQIVVDAENEQEQERKESLPAQVRLLGVRHLYRDMLVRLGAEAVLGGKLNESVEIYQTMYVLGDNTAIYVLHSLLCFLVTEEQKPLEKRTEALRLANDLADEMVKKNLKGATVRKAICLSIMIKLWKSGLEQHVLEALGNQESFDEDQDPLDYLRKSCVSLCMKTLDDKKASSFNFLWACDILNTLQPKKDCYKNLLLGEIFKQPFDALKAYMLGRLQERAGASLPERTACFQIIEHIPLEFLYEYIVRFFQKRKKEELERQAELEERELKEGLKQFKRGGLTGLNEKLQNSSGKGNFGLQEGQMLTPAEARALLVKKFRFEEKTFSKNMKEELMKSRETKDENFEVTSKILFPQPEDYSEDNLEAYRDRILAISSRHFQLLQSSFQSREPWLFKLRGTSSGQPQGKNIPSINLYQGEMPVFTKEEVNLQEGKEELFLKSNQKCKMEKMTSDILDESETLTPFSIKTYGIYDSKGDEARKGKFLLREPLIPDDLFTVLSKPDNFQLTQECQLRILSQLCYMLVAFHISGLYGYLSVPGIFYLTDDEKKTLKLSRNFIAQAETQPPLHNLLPPESLLKANGSPRHLAAQGDVWVLGSIIYMIANRRYFIEPNEGFMQAMLKKREEFLKKGSILCKVLTREDRGPFHDMIESVMRSCLAFEPESRPSAIELLLELHRSLKKISYSEGIFEFTREYSSSQEDFKMVDEILAEKKKNKSKNAELKSRKEFVAPPAQNLTTQTYRIRNVDPMLGRKAQEDAKKRQIVSGKKKPIESQAKIKNPVDSDEESDEPQQKRRQRDLESDEPQRKRRQRDLEIESATSELAEDPNEPVYYLPGNNECLIVQEKKLIYLKGTMEYHLDFKGSVSETLNEARGLVLLKNGCLFDGTFTPDLLPKIGVFKHAISDILAPVSFEPNTLFPKQEVIADLVFNAQDKQKYLESKNKFRRFLAAVKASSDEPRFVDIFGNEYSCKYNGVTQPFLASEADAIIIYRKDGLVYFPNANTALAFDFRNFLLTEYEEVPQAEPPTLMNLLSNLRNASRLTMNSLNRFRFTGSLSEGEPETGSVTFEDQRIFELNGKFREFQPYSCQVLFPDGIYYRGEVLRGKLHGRGELGYYGEPPKFVGEFHNDRMRAGTIFYKDHPKYLRYDGQVKCDGDPLQWKYLKHGRGTLIFRNNDKYEGEFFNDMIEGSGKIYYSDNSVFEGNFIRNLKHGKGVFSGADCTTFVGNYAENKRNGKGHEIYPNGEKYSGDYVNGKREGKGEYIFKNGDKYVGEFKDDKKHGVGELTTDDEHTVIKVKYYKDKLISQAVVNNTFQGFPKQNKKI